jgi:hypothetical protein
MRAILLLCLVTAFVEPRTAEAAGDFDAVAASCMPDASIRPTLYLTTAGTVMHKPTTTGLITLFCPITKPINAPAHLELLYFSTENTPTTFVKATYIKQSKSNGVISNLAIATSMAGANDDQSPHIVTANISDSYNPSSYVYYVRIDLRRRDTNQFAIAYKVTVY